VGAGIWGGVERLSTPLDRHPVTAPARGNPPEALDLRTRRSLWITTVVAGIVAVTHPSLTGALASAHGDGSLRAAHAMLTWPLPNAQPIVSGGAAIVLLGIAVHTNGWRWVTARQWRLLLGIAIAAVVGSGPMVLFCALIVVTFVLVITLALIVVLIIFLLLIVTR
jgi:hypothetical protein